MNDCKVNGRPPPRNGAHFPALGGRIEGRSYVDNWETECLRKGGRYLICKRKDGGSLGEILPFEVEKVVNMTGEVEEIIRKNDGTLLILTKSLEQADMLMKAVRRIGGFEVEMALDDKRNKCRAVVRDKDMQHWDKDVLLQLLAPQGVVAITNIMTRKRYPPGMKQQSDKVEWIPTASFIITFDFPERPEILRVGYLDLVTRDYIPDPLRCFRCQKFGHLSTSCKNKAMCVRCAKEDHKPDNCKNGLLCINCSGTHSAAWKKCPVYEEEKEIRKIMVRQRVPYHIGRRIFKTFVKKGFSYAQALKKPSGCAQCKCPCWTNEGESSTLVQEERVSKEPETRNDEVPKATGNMEVPAESNSMDLNEIASPLDNKSKEPEKDECFSISSIEEEEKYMDVAEENERPISPMEAEKDTNGLRDEDDTKRSNVGKRHNSGDDSSDHGEEHRDASNPNGQPKEASKNAKRKKKKEELQTRRTERRGSSSRSQTRREKSSTALEPGDTYLFQSSVKSSSNVGSIK